MTFDTSQHAGINFRKVYRRANEILASSPAVSSFPFRAKELVREQSDIAFCSFDKARKCHVDIKQFGSESAVLMELDGAYIIFFNQDEVKYRIRFSNGKMVIGPNMFTNTGRWIDYHPQKRKR